MSKRIKLIRTLFLVLAATTRVGLSADTVNTDVVAHVNTYGDGKITLTFHLSASQWETWREQYGDHPDLLWRDLKQRFAKYALDKFDLQRNDIDRTAVANIDARAFATTLGNGTRAIEVEKEARFVSNSGSDWIFESVAQASPYSPIVTETTRVILPSVATNVHVENAGAGPQELVYQMPEGGQDNGLLFWLGIAAIVVGVLLGLVGILLPKQQSSPASSVPSPK
jgi:hypothetical protein